MCTAFKGSRPRVLQISTEPRRILVFTDGACEDRVSIDALALFPSGETQMYGAQSPSDLIDTWKFHGDHKQFIGLVELLPLVVSRLTWSDQMRGKRAFFFVDNESA